MWIYLLHDLCSGNIYEFLLKLLELHQLIDIWRTEIESQHTSQEMLQDHAVMKSVMVKQRHMQLSDLFTVQLNSSNRTIR